MIVRKDILEMLRSTSAFFSWNKEIGIQYLDISDESIIIVNSWNNSRNHEKSEYESHEHESHQVPNIKRPGIELHVKTRHNTSDNLSRTISANKIERENGVQKKAEKTPYAKMESSADNLIASYGDIHSRLFFVSEALNLSVKDNNLFEKDNNSSSKSNKSSEKDNQNIRKKTDPYADPAGELFLKILKAMHLTRENICLCTFEQLDYSRGIPAVRQQVKRIRREIEKIINEAKPQLICTLGDNALKVLMGREYLLSTSRGRFHHYHAPALRFPVYVMPTYHPALLLENPARKKEVWEDMKQIMVREGL